MTIFYSNPQNLSNILLFALSVVLTTPALYSALGVYTVVVLCLAYAHATVTDKPTRLLQRRDCEPAEKERAFGIL